MHRINAKFHVLALKKQPGESIKMPCDIHHCDHLTAHRTIWLWRLRRPGPPIITKDIMIRPRRGLKPLLLLWLMKGGKGDAVGNGKGEVKAFVLMNVRAGTSPEVVSRARQIPGVISANACWGRPGIFVVLEAPNEKVLSDAVLNKLQLIQSMESTDIHLVIE